MFGKAFLAVLMLFACGCTDPTYLANGGENNRQRGLGKECPAQFRESGYCVRVKWIKTPTETERGSFSFRIYQLADDDFPIGVKLAHFPEVLLWMPSMGHGSSPVKVSLAADGVYVADDVFFIMPGEWQIKFQLKSDDRVSDEAVLDYVF